MEAAWKTLLLVVRATAPLASGDGNVLLSIGTKPQQAEVGDLRLLNLGPKVTPAQVKAAFRAQAPGEPRASAIWKEWVEAQKAGRSTRFPDYSWAGYRVGDEKIPDVKGPVFEATNFGARPDTPVDSLPALQRAVDAAAAAGGGVVHLSPGTYWMRADARNRKALWVTNSRVVIRGSGMGEGGTVLRLAYHSYRQETEIPPANGGSFNDASGRFLIQMGSPRTPSVRCGDEGGGYVAPTNGTPRLATVALAAKQGSFTVIAKENPAIRAGQWLVLYLRSKAWTAEQMGGRAMRKE